MNLLFGETIPFTLRDSFIELNHNQSVSFAQEEGWGGLTNGELLDEASESFEVFVSCDQELLHQRNLSKYDIGVIILKGRTNRRKDLEPLLPELVNTLKTADSSTYQEIGA